MTRERIQEMRRAGITWVQPGVENLHTEALRLMDKGIQGWQNVQFLKMARELGLTLTWSILWGLPGEKDEWYGEMADWIPALEHIPPPTGFGRIQFDRYSVYHEEAQRFGLILFPIGSLSFVYPVGPADLDGLAYYFATEPGVGPLRYTIGELEAVSRTPGVQAMDEALNDWKISHEEGQPMLSMAQRGEVLEITDSRSCRSSERHVLTGLARAVCLACDAAPQQAKLAEIVARDHGITATDGQLAEITGKLLADRLILAMDGRFVGVALKGTPRALATEFPGGDFHISDPGYI
jgi:Radical SAM superfamily